MASSNAKRRGLGRGLGALIPTAPDTQDRTSSPVSTYLLAGTREHATVPAEAPGAAPSGAGPATAAQAPAPPDPATPAPEGPGYFAELPVEAVRPNPRQPREVFDEDDLAELVHSIREVGLLQPVVVRPLGDERYELVMGERRLRASRLAGTPTIPAIVRSTPDENMLRDALLENLHRAELNPLEEAAAYGQLLEDFGCTHDELARRIGRSRPQISNTLRLLKLPPAVQRRVAAGVLSAGHARALVAVGDAGTADALAARVVAEGLSVRALEEIVTVSNQAEGTGPKVRTPRARPAIEGAGELADRLSDRLDTRVRVEGGSRRGRIVIDFASAEDLARIAAVLESGTGA